MEKEFYLQYAAVENKHWWFVGRRKIVEKVIQQLKLPVNTEILEAGCGTGGNLAMLSRYGNLSAMEIEEIACQIANERKITTVKKGSLPDNIPLKGEYGLIVMLDVLEHINDDIAALEALYSLLKPGGYLLITVPAFPFLWSHHDEINHHYRRYLKITLQRVAIKAGYKLNYTTYFNFFLFPIVAIIRSLKKILKIDDSNSNISSDLNIPAKLINKFLTYLFASECHMINRLSLPFGVSLLLVAQKSNQ
jgi:SAM-dependent methyltransferase